MKEVCGKKRCGEYNMLKCYLTKGHTGECCFAVNSKNERGKPIAREWAGTHAEHLAGGQKK